MPPAAPPAGRRRSVRRSVAPPPGGCWQLGDRVQVSQSSHQSQWADGVVVRYEPNGRPVVAVEGYAAHSACYASGMEVVWDSIRLPRARDGAPAERPRAAPADPAAAPVSPGQRRKVSVSAPPGAPGAGGRPVGGRGSSPRASIRRGSSLRKRATDSEDCLAALLDFSPRHYRMRGRRRAPPPSAAARDGSVHELERELHESFSDVAADVARAFTTEDSLLCGDVASPAAGDDGDAARRPPQPAAPEGGDDGFILCVFAEVEVGRDPRMYIVCTDCADELFEIELGFVELCRLQGEHYHSVPLEARRTPALWRWGPWLDHLAGMLTSSHACDVLWPHVPPEHSVPCPREGCRAAFANEKMLRNHLLYAPHRPPSPLSPEAAAARRREAVQLRLTDRSAAYTGLHHLAEGGDEPALGFAAEGDKEAAAAARRLANPPRLSIHLRRRDAEAWQVRQWVATRMAASATLSGEAAAEEDAGAEEAGWGGDAASARRPWAPVWRSPWSPPADD